MLEIIAQKIGMSRKYLQNGSSKAITLIKVYDNIVIDYNKESNQNNIKIGFNKLIKTNNTNKSIVGFYSKKNISVHKFIKESKLSSTYNPNVGQSIDYNDIIKIGDKISIQGITSGKGFAGVMKRWNFSGLEATHGVSISHRSHGSTGQRQDPGKTFKGKKMAGHLGCDKITVKNLTIEYLDLENSIIGVSGSVPGNKGENIVLKFKNF
jgi:large subunit ribosomal protein L3